MPHGNPEVVTDFTKKATQKEGVLLHTKHGRMVLLIAAAIGIFLVLRSKS